MIKNIESNREGVNNMTKRNTNAAPAKETEVEAEEVTTFSAKDLAAELGIDAKAFRRWLRAHTGDRANKGGRWLFTEESRTAFIELYRSTRSAAGTEPTVKA